MKNRITDILTSILEMSRISTQEINTLTVFANSNRDFNYNYTHRYNQTTGITSGIITITTRITIISVYINTIRIAPATTFRIALRITTRMRR